MKRAQSIRFKKALDGTIRAISVTADGREQPFKGGTLSVPGKLPTVKDIADYMEAQGFKPTRPLPNTDTRFGAEGYLAVFIAPVAPPASEEIMTGIATLRTPAKDKPEGEGQGEDAPKPSAEETDAMKAVHDQVRKAM